MRRIYLNDGESAVNVGRFSRFVRTGEFRPPLKGEWYLSGAIPQAWQAPNDLSTAYHILRPAVRSACPCCGQEVWK